MRFLHSVISLNQLLPHFKNTADIFLTFIQSILNTVLKKCCLPKDLSIRRDRTDRAVKTQIRLLLQEQSDQVLHCLSFHHAALTMQLFGPVSMLISGVPIPPAKCLLIAFECRNRSLWAVTVRIMFLLDQQEI